MPKSKSALAGRGGVAGSPGFLGARGGTALFAGVVPCSAAAWGSVRGGEVGGKGEGLGLTTALGLSGRGLLTADAACACGGTTRPGATSCPGSGEAFATSTPTPGGTTSIVSPCAASEDLGSTPGEETPGEPGRACKLGSTRAGEGGAGDGVKRGVGDATVGSALSDLVAWSRTPLPATGERPARKMTTAAAAHTTSPATRCGRWSGSVSAMRKVWWVRSCQLCVTAVVRPESGGGASSRSRGMPREAARGRGNGTVGLPGRRRPANPDGSLSSC